jgi:hypothetical protein
MKRRGLEKELTVLMWSTLFYCFDGKFNFFEKLDEYIRKLIQ